MKGITLATYTAWRKKQGMSVPTKTDLRNITDDEVEQIYYGNYWLVSGADKQAWPLSLANFDAAVNSGPGNAGNFLKAGGGFDGFMSARIDFLTRTSEVFWGEFGRGVLRRCADLLKEGSK